MKHETEVVAIVMATYNGELFLKEQINSIIFQSHKNWILYISDDNSNDGTLNILMEYEKLDDRVIVVNKNRQGGVARNFAKALTKVNEKYIALADQDDIWSEDHLELLLDEIISVENIRNFQNKPVLVFSNLKVVDKNRMLIANSLYDNLNINPLKNVMTDYILWACSIYGCTTIFNRAAKVLSQPLLYKLVMCHDQFLALNCSINGVVVYLNKNTIDYRQHSHNVMGGGEKKTIIKYFHPKSINKNIINLNIVARQLAMFFCFHNVSNYKINVFNFIKLIIKREIGLASVMLFTFTVLKIINFKIFNFPKLNS